MAVNGDTIYLAGGTYTGTGAAVITVTRSVAILGGWDGAASGQVIRDPRAYPTRLDGENQRRVVYVDHAITPTLAGLVVTGGNASNAPNAGRGGGIYAEGADPIIVGNIVSNNIAYTGTTTGHGGGVYLISASATTLISGNIIVSNTANTAAQGRGGGLTMYSSPASIRGNVFRSNVAGPTPNSQGGGLYLGSSSAIVSDNLIQGNQAAADLSGFGGGFYSQFGEVTLSRNAIFSNSSGYGAVTLNSNARFTMTNNVVGRNLGGVFVQGNATFPFTGTLAHNTIVENDSQAVYVGWYGSGHSSVTLINNIIVSHTTGIFVYEDPTNQVTATHILFYGNDADAAGLPIVGTNEITGSAPHFADPAGLDYHLLAGSPAIDAGTPVPWLTTDIDGEPRPMGTSYDIGVDEVPSRAYLPLIARGYQP
jgi:hypothetical protein